jgi:hypothetical protein
MAEAIVYPRRFHRVAEIYFAAEAPSVDADVLEFIQAPVPVPRAHCSEFHTIVLDLRRDHGALWDAMARTTRYQTRRAGERDGIRYFSPQQLDSTALKRFFSFCDSFRRRKGLPALDLARLQIQTDAGALELSMVTDPDGSELGWHAYYRDSQRVRLLHSASLLAGTEDHDLRSVLGRANRYHHWQDVLYFQSQGLSIYDFGGWYHGSEDREKLGINAFKEGFGGTHERAFNCTRASSPRGVAVLSVKRMRTIARRGLEPA